MKKLGKLVIVISAFILFIEYVGITGKDIQRTGEKMWKWANN